MTTNGRTGDASATARLLVELEQSVLETPGTLGSEDKKAAFHGEVAPDLRDYVDKVRNHAYKVTQDDIERLKAGCLSEDQIFELTIATAVGAGLSRWGAGKRALEQGGPA